MSLIYTDAVGIYQAAGWPSVLPVQAKELLVRGVTGRQGRMPTPIDYKKWLLRYEDRNAALRLPKYLIGIDVDAYDDKPGAQTLAELEERWGQLPCTIRSSARIGDPLSGIRFFRVPEEAEVVTEFPGIEIIQFHHRYAVVWPSIHPDLLVQYKWWSTDGELMDRAPQPSEFPWLPEPWWEGLRAAAPASGEPGGSSGDSQRGAAGARSTLAALLESPPDGASGRNNWLTRVAGHLAKVIPWQDGYEALLAAIDAGLAVPYESTDAGGIKKLAVSVWDTEQRGKVADDGELPRQETGWLAGDGQKLWVMVEIGKDAAKTQKLVECSDFDLRVLGKYVDADLGTHYRLQVTSSLQEVRYLVEPASRFGSPRDLMPRLRALELNIWPVGGDLGSIEAKNPANRLGHYLSTQEAPRLQTAPFMGWSDEAGGFVCNEGVITAEGLDQHSIWIPSPAIHKRDKATHRYGFEGDWAAAQGVLKEVLTYQDDLACSVFGAWWAATLVKAQIMPKVAGFPFVAIEATSGSGKSEGFLKLMVRLNGATRLGGQHTAATFRDAMASNRSGIVHIDDMNDPTQLYQDIRTATNESYRTKKGIDRYESVSVQMVAPVLLTGESLPRLDEELALADRIIRIELPPAKDRKSRNGDYPQWDDILALQNRYPEPWRISGWYVQEALRHWPAVEAQWKNLRNGNGRHADKLTVLRAGARLLDLLTEDGWHAEHVDEWCGVQAPPEHDFLVNRILPELLRDSGMIAHAIGWQPVWVNDEGIVWWHPGKVHDAWTKKYRSGDNRVRAFGETTALMRHRQAMGVTKEDRGIFDVHMAGERRAKKPYYPCPPDISARVIETAES